MFNIGKWSTKKKIIVGLVVFAVILSAIATLTDSEEPPAPVAPSVTATPTESPLIEVVGEPVGREVLKTATWRGLVIADEDRCSPYDKRRDYPYPASVEDKIIAEMGGHVYGPYTGKYFATKRMTDIEHMVAASEAHDSGLCAADSATRKAFARDLLNLTLAAPSVNRYQKSDKDAADWLPAVNKCWFADRVVRVREKYALTIDEREAAALDGVFASCESFEMVFAGRAAATSIPTATAVPTATVVPTPMPTSTPKPTVTPVPTFTPTPIPTATPEPVPTATVIPTPIQHISPFPPNPPQVTIPTLDALALYDDNDNGRITCAEARRHGIAPVDRDHPAYQYMRDGDGDGTVCE